MENFELFFILLVVGIIYAFYKYGNIQWWNGYDKGARESYTSGVYQGSKSIIDLLIRLDVITVEQTEQIAKELLTGVHDSKFNQNELKLFDELKKKKYK